MKKLLLIEFPDSDPDEWEFIPYPSQDITPERFLEIYNRADAIRNQRWSAGSVTVVTPADIQKVLEEI